MWMLLRGFLFIMVVILHFLLQPVYIKDDFFDTLSCNALDRGYRNERPRFSEQMKIDTEVCFYFGKLSSDSKIDLR